MFHSATILRAGLIVLALAGATPGADAAIINITPSDNYSKIEAAQAGDEVVIAPGTYRFRVYLTGQGTALNPIRIRAQDPNNKPVWDFSATLVESAPGSYTAGDRGRGGWQVSGGAHYRISGLIITGCHTTSKNSAGLRYYNGTTGLEVSDCIFRANDNGVTGGTQDSDAVFEFCEFDANGNLGATAATHNLYIYGGTFALRYSYVHDSVQAENFHIRAHTSYLEFNWFARARNYEGDLMTNIDFAGGGPFTQTMLIRGNVFIQSSNPTNHGQVLVIFNDGGLANVNMSMQIIGNTYIGNGLPGNGGGASFVHLSNADGTTMSAVVSNNIIFGTTLPTLIEDPIRGSVQGTNNWLQAGVSPGGLIASIFSLAPGFQNAATFDYTLTAGSSAIGTAAPLTPGLRPTREYFQNQIVARGFRTRLSARDLGALETTTVGAGIGPTDPPPSPVLSAQFIGGNVALAWPLTASGFVLEQITALDGSAAWTAVPGPSPNSAVGFSAAVPPPGGAAFYRLAKP